MITLSFEVTWAKFNSKTPAPKGWPVRMMASAGVVSRVSTSSPSSLASNSSLSIRLPCGSPYKNRYPPPPSANLSIYGILGVCRVSAGVQLSTPFRALRAPCGAVTVRIMVSHLTK
ncbi:hypothetical protein An16g00490 [Aspergillus niger]|uniref:Uncharacterized protein n=2 Tax=Aspergillus niger TaxID=5061 RepID=A2R6M2_ASPNC|nr:hypothetical protein An16g00490 [Aspergillus niger]CAK42730.1 hypothetical protein An16g00490 [Aspergillus niger]